MNQAQSSASTSISTLHICICSDIYCPCYQLSAINSHQLPLSVVSLVRQSREILCPTCPAIQQYCSVGIKAYDMRSVWRLAPVVRQSRYNSVRLGVSFALCRRLPVISTSPVLLRERHYAQSVAAAKTPDHDGSSFVDRPDHGERTAARLESLVREINKTIQQDVGGNDAWSRRLERVVLDLAVPRRRRIGGACCRSSKQRVHADESVIGDQLAMPDSLVSALLQDPISESSASRDALLSRPQSATGSAFEIS